MCVAMIKFAHAFVLIRGRVGENTLVHPLKRLINKWSIHAAV